MISIKHIILIGVFLVGLSLCLLARVDTPAVWAEDSAGSAPQESPLAEAADEEEMGPMEKSIQGFCAKVFQPVLAPFFQPINRWLGMIPDGAANYFGIGLFVCAMIWVGLILNPAYVNRGRPYKSFFTDLRLWTVLSMAPHVFFYFYFR